MSSVTHANFSVFVQQVTVHMVLYQKGRQQADGKNKMQLLLLLKKLEQRLRHFAAGK